MTAPLRWPDSPSVAPRIPFTVIGGFLGAGKTTLVNWVLAQTANRRVAILVNDFGNLAIDAALVSQQSATTISLTNGCVCCSLVGGLAQALLDVLHLDPAPDHIVVEASGVSDPRRIAQIARADSSFMPDATIVLMAADQLLALTCDRYVGDTVLAQVAAADFLILNKLDLVSAEETDAIRARLATLAPHARLIETVNAQVPCDVVLGHTADRVQHLAGSPISRRPIATPRGVATRAPLRAHAQDHEGRFSTHTFRCREPVSGLLLRRALDALPAAVLRAKGLIRIDDAPEAQQLIQAVGSRWSLSPFAAGDMLEASALVIIGSREALAEADLTPLAAAFRSAPPSISRQRTGRRVLQWDVR